MNKEQFKTRYNLTEDQFTGKEKIGGDLDLGSVTSLPDGRFGNNEFAKFFNA